MPFKFKLSRRLAIIWNRRIARIPVDLLIVLSVLLLIVTLPTPAQRNSTSLDLPIRDQSRYSVRAVLMAILVLAAELGGSSGLQLAGLGLVALRISWHIASVLFGPVCVERNFLPHGERRARYRRLFGYLAIPWQARALACSMRRRADIDLAMEVFVGRLSWRFRASMSDGRE